MLLRVFKSKKPNLITTHNCLFLSLSNYLDNFNELVNAGVAGEYRLPQQQLRHHAARAPHV